MSDQILCCFTYLFFFVCHGVCSYRWFDQAESSSGGGGGGGGGVGVCFCDTRHHAAEGGYERGGRHARRSCLNPKQI